MMELAEIILESYRVRRLRLAEQYQREFTKNKKNSWFKSPGVERYKKGYTSSLTLIYDMDKIIKRLEALVGGGSP